MRRPLTNITLHQICMISLFRPFVCSHTVTVPNGDTRSGLCLPLRSFYQRRGHGERVSLIDQCILAPRKLLINSLAKGKVW